MTFKEKRATIWIPSLFMGVLMFYTQGWSHGLTPLQDAVNSSIWTIGCALFIATLLWMENRTQN